MGRGRVKRGSGFPNLHVRFLTEIIRASHPDPDRLVGTSAQARDQIGRTSADAVLATGGKLHASVVPDLDETKCHRLIQLPFDAGIDNGHHKENHRHPNEQAPSPTATESELAVGLLAWALSQATTNPVGAAPLPANLQTERARGLQWSDRVGPHVTNLHIEAINPPVAGSRKRGSLRDAIVRILHASQPRQNRFRSREDGTAGCQRGVTQGTICRNSWWMTVSYSRLRGGCDLRPFSWGKGRGDDPLRPSPRQAPDAA